MSLISFVTVVVSCALAVQEGGRATHSAKTKSPPWSLSLPIRPCVELKGRKDGTAKEGTYTRVRSRKVAIASFMGRVADRERKGALLGRDTA